MDFEAAIEILESVVGKPIYAVALSDTPFDGQSAHGFTALENADLVVRPYVADWRGRGHACVVDFDSFEHHHPDKPIGTLLHELAHCLEHHEPLEREPLDAPPSAEAMELAEQRRSDWREFWDLDDWETWRSHGRPFIRAAAHVHYRAWQKGLRVEPGLVFFSQHRRPFKAYLKALLPELESRVHEPLNTVLESPIPEELQILDYLDSQLFGVDLLLLPEPAD